MDAHRRHRAVLARLLLALVAPLGCGAVRGGPDPASTPAPRDPLARALAERARQKLEDGAPEAALGVAEEGLKLAPDDAELWQLKGQAEFLLARYPDALRSLAEAARDRPRDRELLYLRGESALQANRSAEAERFLGELIAIDPGYKNAAKRLGLLYVSAGRLDKAEAALRTAREALPGDLEVVLHLASLLRKQGRLDEALAAIEPAASSAGSAALAYELGLLRRQRGERAEARAALERAVALDPWLEGAWNQLAQVLREGGDAAAAGEARRRFEQAQAAAEQRRVLENELAHDPSNVALLVRLGQHLARQGRIAEAEPLFARAVLIAPTQSGAALLLARARLRLGRAAEAVGAFERVRDASPGDASVRLELAEALVLAGKPETAAVEAGAAETGLAAAPAESWQRLGAVFESVGQLERAERAYERALAAAPGLADALAGRGLVRARLGRAGAARADLERALAAGTTRAGEVRTALSR